MDKNFQIYKSPYGYFRIEYNENAVILLEKVDVSDDNLDMGVSSELSEKVIMQLNEYFEGKRKEFDFPYEVQGTEFQKKVWNALCDIPYGETRTYKEIATAVGNPKASRAVGMANNKNPIAIAVPCHRVIGANGKLVGYAGGLPMKEKLLEIEKYHK